MIENLNELFWNADLETIKQGYMDREKDYACIICGETFTKGQIYSIDGNLYDARKTAQLHIAKEHHSMLHYMLGMNTNFLGITEVQKQFIEMLATGINDKEIATKLSINPSTVRNHRYRLREKEKQAKLFLALMQLLQDVQNKPLTVVGDSKLQETSKTATMVDDRYDTTEAEKQKILSTYFDEVGRLKNYPAKEKRKIIVLSHISTLFKKGRFYSEAEINRTLERIYDDYVTLRRALIEYGFMDRVDGGTQYWIKE